MLAFVVALSPGTGLAAVVTRGPYLQQTTPYSVIVRWRTDVPTNAVVHVGLRPGALTFSTVTSAALTTEHEILVAISLGVSMIPLVAPNFFDQFPPWTAPLTHSGITLGALCAVLLNAILNAQSSAQEKTIEDAALEHW